MNNVRMEDKVRFVKWLLDNHKMKKREVVWILNFMSGSKEIMKNVHFVDDAHHCPRALIISTTETDTVSFRFYKGQIMTADAEKAYHDIRLNKNDELFIGVNFPNKHKSSAYLSVLVENPYLPYNKTHQVSPENEEMVNGIVGELEKINVLQEIDKALDNGDERLFADLCEILNKIKVDKDAVENVNDTV
ncbi:ReoY family proteolytic degradation factor [Sporosarcina sp. FSL W7-1283]|uniref:ReoY family proteolytic degradation factor n=1 Tax=Sporosarcina sp. FSL W7-1283 TaxID=2921560 RepID=UPI0030F84D8E